jgi:anti-sigma factor RsiW
MSHLSEEQIVLHYYGDAEDATEVERHLAACAECRAELARVQSMLQQIEPLEVPEPGAGFEEKDCRRAGLAYTGGTRGFYHAPYGRPVN